MSASGSVCVIVNRAQVQLAADSERAAKSLNSCAARFLLLSSVAAPMMAYHNMHLSDSAFTLFVLSCLQRMC